MDHPRVSELLIKSLERAYLGATAPVVGWLIGRRVRPNTLTTIGALMVAVSAGAYGFGWIRLGGALLLLSGVIDTFDGQVARQGGQVSKFGAFYDSTLDRVGDGATFVGIAAYLLKAPGVSYRIETAVVCMVAILSSLLVSYARARAEGLGIDCKVGLIQRAERMIIIGVPSVIIGAGPDGLILQGIAVLLAVLSTVTVVQRFVYVYRQTEGADRAR